MIVNRFLNDFQKKGKSKFSILGIKCENLENEAMMKYYNLDENDGLGIIVRRIHPFSFLKNILAPGDVIT